MSAPFYVYTVFDADRRPLYVGQTNRLRRRFKEHGQTGVMDHAAFVALIPFATRKEALDAETRRIRKLRPALNIQHNPRFITVADAIGRHEWSESFRLLNGSRADRHRWLALHPEATAADRKWIARRDVEDSRRRAS